MNGIVKVIVESSRLSSWSIVRFFLVHVLPLFSGLIWIRNLGISLWQLREFRWNKVGGSSLNPCFLMGGNGFLYFGRVGDGLEWNNGSVVGSVEARCISPVFNFVVLAVGVDVLVGSFGFAVSIDVFDACLIPVAVAEFRLTETVLE